MQNDSRREASPNGTTKPLVVLRGSSHRTEIELFETGGNRVEQLLRSGWQARTGDQMGRGTEVSGITEGQAPGG
ncbi:hypothetical protein GCM10009753_66750 [Streptantibioticus ferralitis]